MFLQRWAQEYKINIQKIWSFRTPSPPASDFIISMQTMTISRKAASGEANPSSHRQDAVPSVLRFMLQMQCILFCYFHLSSFQ